MSKLPKLNPYSITVLFFLIFALSLPRFMELLFPCLRNLSMQTFAYDHCNTTIVLDRFLQISLTGQAILIAILFAIKRNIKKLVAAAAILGIITTISFYSFIPSARQKVESSDIYLDSLLEGN